MIYDEVVTDLGIDPWRPNKPVPLTSAQRKREQRRVWRDQNNLLKRVQA